jgi:hypothetical protein
MAKGVLTWSAFVYFRILFRASCLADTGNELPLSPAQETISAKN